MGPTPTPNPFPTPSHCPGGSLNACFDLCPPDVFTACIDDNTVFGKLKEVKQFYHQNGQTIEHSLYTVNGNKHDSVTTDFCEDWVAERQDGTNFLEKGGIA